MTPESSEATACERKTKDGPWGWYSKLATRRIRKRCHAPKLARLEARVRAFVTKHFREDDHEV